MRAIRGVRELIAARLAAHNAGAGSASQVRRVLLLDEPPAIDAGEITDKGYVNQRAVLRRRAELVTRLYAEPRGPRRHRRRALRAVAR